MAGGHPARLAFPGWVYGLEPGASAGASSAGFSRFDGRPQRRRLRPQSPSMPSVAPPASINTSTADQSAGERQFKLLSGQISGNALAVRMKTPSLITLGLLLVLAGTVGAAADSERLARIYFAGATQLAADTNTAKFKEIGALPATLELREQILARLARMPNDLFKDRIDTAHLDRSARFRPLWEDAWNAEWVAEWQQPATNQFEWVLAIRLSGERSQIWSTNLWQIMTEWRAGEVRSVKTGDAAGWEVKKHHAPNYFRFLRLGDWCVLGLGQEQLPTQLQMLDQIRKSGQPYADQRRSWLDVEANLAGLAKWFRSRGLYTWAPTNLPQAHLTMFGRGESVRSQLLLRYATAQSWPTERWQIPTNILRDPLASFSAVQGVGPWLSAHQRLQPLGLPAWPNQLYAWSYQGIPFQSFAAAPIANASNLLNILAGTLPASMATNLPMTTRGEIKPSTNRLELSWQGLPFVIPFLRPVNSAAGEFLVGGFFPPMPSTNPPPAELLSQVVNRTNLLYYGWEITQERLDHWRAMSQLYSLLTTQTGRVSRSPATTPPRLVMDPWLMAVAPKLGNTITEITVTAPNELTLTRKSDLGGNGLEIVLLARWLENPGFPLFGYKLPPHLKNNPPAPPAKP